MVGAEQISTWPIPKFNFSVDFDDVARNIPFQEVSGLDIESQTIEFRTGNSKTFSSIKMPGIRQFGNVTMKKGIFINDDAFWDWYSQIKLNTIKRLTVNVKLLDESGKVTMNWALNNAWPTKITGSDLKSDNNEVAIETIEFAHEGLTITNS